MGRVTRHSKQRIIERTEGVESFAEAKKIAKQAYISGKTLNHYQQYPKFFNYLGNKRDQTNTCSIRIYKGNIFIWRGKGKHKSLITAHPIPDRYIEEINKINSKNGQSSSENPL